MKKITLILVLISFAIAYALPVAGQQADFNGIWKLDRDQSTLAEYSPTLVRIDVRIGADSLLTERYYDTGDGQEYPFTENLKLDGKESSITIYDMPRKTKATWSDQDTTVNVESKTTFNGDNGQEDFVSKETWKIDNVTKTLTITFKNSTSAGEASGFFLFKKAE
jgi:hypothetical protein